MTAPKNHSDVLKALHDNALFSSDEIKAMPVEMVKHFLKEDGMDIAKLTEKMKRQKELWLGSKQYQEACATTPDVPPAEETMDLSAFSESQLKAEIEQYYKTNDLPMAARGFKGFHRKELESMYRDLLRKKPNG
jgi:hypothetical protein